jgi:metal-responsive CopG/Arc/MetJ family transcriptional regulator
MVILFVMKTAISIPDKLFRAADRYAKSHGFTRSKLYAKAVAQFLEQHPSGLITRQLDEIYSSEPAKLDETLSTMQLSSIETEKW